MTMQMAWALLLLLAAVTLGIRSLLRIRCLGRCAFCSRAQGCPGKKEGAPADFVPVPWDGNQP